MRTVTTRYEVIRYPFTSYGRCPVCGKRAQRSRTFTATENPYNRNDDGTPKVFSEIYADLRVKAEAWQPDLTHDKCKDGAEK